MAYSIEIRKEHNKYVDKIRMNIIFYIYQYRYYLYFAYNNLLKNDI